MSHSFAPKLLDWYEAHQRRLPWRGARDPYRIWVAEIMLQQTRVETVIPYYRRWLKRFPSVRALATASEQEVLALWEGLGYYSRARNLQRAAQRVVAEHDSRLPSSVEELRALPGVGAYTAAAVASIAFGADVAALDGNVRRVLVRVFDVRRDVKSPVGEKQLRALAQGLVPAGQAGDFNQALMDLGATVCLPRAPACPACPLRSLCRARQLGVQAERPVKRRHAPLPHRTLAAALIRRGERVLLAQRGARRLLGGLWAFPQVEVPDAAQGPRALKAALRRGLRAEMGLEVRVGAPAQTLTHTFTHFRMTLHVFECRRLSGSVNGVLQWAPVADLGRYPMGKTDRQIALSLRSIIEVE